MLLMAGSKPTVVIATSKHKQSQCSSACMTWAQQFLQVQSVTDATGCSRRCIALPSQLLLLLQSKSACSLQIVRLLSHPPLNCWVMPSKEHPATADVLNAAVLAW
jgi:hypothetical protein